MTKTFNALLWLTLFYRNNVGKQLSFTIELPVSLVRESLRSVEDHPALIEQARQLKDLITKLSSLRLDQTEFTCLKALVLFRPGRRNLWNSLHWTFSFNFRNSMHYLLPCHFSMTIVWRVIVKYLPFLELIFGILLHISPTKFWKEKTKVKKFAPLVFGLSYPFNRS